MRRLTRLPLERIRTLINPPDATEAAQRLLLVGVFILGAGFGYVYWGTESFRFRQIVQDLYANGGSELLSIAMTVLVIDSLNQRRDMQERKQTLARQMKSRSNEAALEAIDQLIYEGWWDEICDNHRTRQGQINFGDVRWSGVKAVEFDLEKTQMEEAHLQRADLRKANLREAHLREANLQYARLSFANMEERSILEDANLQHAQLKLANLQYVNLTGANLEGADLEGTNLQNAELLYVNLQRAYMKDANLRDVRFIDTAMFDEFTILPDAKPLRDRNRKVVYGENGKIKYTPESYWTPKTDMSRYTNPQHPNFWEPEEAIRQQ